MIAIACCDRHRFPGVVAVVQVRVEDRQLPGARGTQEKPISEDSEQSTHP